MELGDGARLVGLHVLQVEAADQEVVAPDVLGHEVDLRARGAHKHRPSEVPFTVERSEHSPSILCSIIIKSALVRDENPSG